MLIFSFWLITSKQFFYSFFFEATRTFSIARIFDVMSFAVHPPEMLQVGKSTSLFLRLGSNINTVNTVSPVHQKTCSVHSHSSISAMPVSCRATEGAQNKINSPRIIHLRGKPKKTSGILSKSTPSFLLFPSFCLTIIWATPCWNVSFRQGTVKLRFAID